METETSQQNLARVRPLMTALAVAYSTCAAVAQPVFQGLGDLPGGPYGSAANGISADGRTVIGIGDWDRSSGANQAFRWTAEGGMVALGRLPRHNFSFGFRPSATGEFAVGDSSRSSGPRQAVRWSANGEILGLGDFPGGGVDSWAVAVSSDGSTVAGTGTNANGFQAFRWRSDTGMSSLGSLEPSHATLTGDMSADGRVITGVDAGPSTTEAFLWTEEAGMRGLGDLPGGPFLSAGTDVSSDGRIVVGSGGSPDGFEAMLWTEESGMIGLGELPGDPFLSVAQGVSADGSIVVGRSATGRGPQWWLQEAFIWDASQGMRNLREVLMTEHGADLTDWLLLDGSGISDDGRTIVGLAQNPAGQLEAYVARIPEPGTLVMFLVLGLLDTRRW